MKDAIVYLLLGLAAIGLGLGVSSNLDDARLCGDKKGSELVSYLFVQEAASGDIALNEDGTYTLALADVSPQTLVFADRPVRDAFYVETSDLVAAFDRLFGDDPPNATLSYTSTSGELRTAVFEILSPIGEAGLAVTYQVVLIPVDGESVTPGEPPSTFGEASLFIDSLGFQCPAPPLPKGLGCP